MQVATRTSRLIPRPPEAVFDDLVAVPNMPKLFKKSGPIPAVVSVDSEPSALGAKRQVKMSDGSIMGEEITAFDRGRTYRYRWMNKPKFPFGLLVKAGDSHLTFAPSGSGTQVDWTYTFDLTTPLVWPLAAPVVALFRGWMAQALRLLETLPTSR